MENNYRSVNPPGLTLKSKRPFRLAFAFLLMLLFAGGISFAQTAFTGGNLVVVRVGSGSAALGTTATQVGVSEYSTAGTLAQALTFQSSTTIPAAGVAPFLNLSGSTANEGFGSTSIDGAFFALLGYNTTNATAGVNAVTANRSIGRVSGAGVLSIPVTNTVYGVANTIRSVASDGTGYWATTSSTSTVSGGLAYINSTGTVTPLNALNGRCVGIFNGQLFANSQTSVQAFGTGLPTSGTVTGTSIATVTNGAAFCFSPNHDVLYVADESSGTTVPTTAGGIRKFTRAAGTSTWTFQYTLNSNLTSGASGTTPARGLVVDWSGSSPILYFTEATGAANRIMKVIDNGSALSSSNTSGTAPTAVVPGVTNIRLAGISFAPKTPSIVLSGAASVAPHTRAADNYTEGSGPITTATSSFVVNGYNLGGNITVTAPTNFQVSTSATTGFASSITLTPTTGSVSNQTVYVRMAGSLTAASYTGYVSVTAAGCPQPGGVYVTGTVNTATPSITAPASLPVSLTGFVTTAGAFSNAQTITLTAANLTSALTITASSGYEISSGGAYSSSLNLGTSISGLVINVRVAASATTSTTTGTITTSSSDVPVNGLTLANLSATVYSGLFTAGNIAVEVVGDGTSGLSSAAAQVNVWELNSTTGALANPFMMPRAGTLPTVSPFNITESGSATSGGQMVRSSNKAFLSVSGYNATVATGAVVATTTPTNKRVLGRLSSTGTVTTTAYDFFSGNNFRSTASNGYSFWCAGTVNSGVGLYYLQNASSTPVSLGSINTRVVQVYNNNLYFSSASTGGVGIYQAGSNGLPVKAADAAVTRLTDATFAAQAGASPYSFSINSAGNVLYIADDATFSSTSTQLGGIIKYTKSGSTWTYQYTLRVNSVITNGARGLEVDWSGANPVLYITSGNSSGIYKLTDNGVAASGTGVLLATAPANYAFRALQFAPVAQPTELTCTANSLDFGGQPPAGVSAEKAFNVAGSGFTGNITVSVPSTSPAGQYGISLTSGGPYTSTVTITGSGTPNSGNATIYMVFQPTTVGTYNGNLAISASGVSTFNVAVTGSCILPVNYYNVSGADVTIPSNWGTNTNGSGTNPVNFTDNGQYFNVVNATAALSAMQTTAALSPTASTSNGQIFLTFSNPPSCPNSPVSYFVGATISGTGIPIGTTITDITGNVITMSAAATSTNAGITVSVPVAAGWAISGIISKLIVGNGTVARTFTIPSTHAYTGTVDVKDLGNLVLQNSTIPTLGILDLNSTVNYNHTGTISVVIPSANGPYGNLTLQGSAAATDIRNLPASSPITLPFQVLGNLTADNVTVLGATGAPFTYMGLQGNITGTNGALFGGNPATSTSAVASIVTIGDGNQTFSYPGGVIGSYIFSSTKAAGTLTLGTNTTFLTYGQSGTFTGTQLIYSGTAAFVSNSGSTLATTATANVDVTCTGSASFTLGGNIDAKNTSSSLFTIPIAVSSSVYFNMAAGTSFADGGNTITVSNNFGTTGSAAAYNFTGTAIMAPASGTSRIQNTSALQGLFVADLNNLQILPTSSAANIIVQPLTGNNVLTVKGDFTIGGTATGSKFQPNANTIQIAGNFSDSRTIDMLASGTSTYEFNGNSAQTITTAFASGESFYNVKISNTSGGVSLASGNIKITSTGNLNCSSGILTTGSNKVILNNTASISESTTSFVTGNVESTRTLTNALEAFGGLGIEVTALGSAPGSTTVTRVTGTSEAIGCEAKSNKRVFNFGSVATNTGLNATIKYKWLGSTQELNGLDENYFNIFTGGGPWTLINPNAVANAAGNYVTVTGQNNLDSYVVSTAQPSLGSITQNAICAGNSASVALGGLLANADFTVNYTVNGVAQAAVTGVTSDGSGDATFSSAVLNSTNNGQTLAITSLVRTDITPNCTANFSTGNSVTLAVNPNPTLSSTAQTGVACENTNAVIALTGLVPSTTATFTYTINGGPAQVLSGVISNGSGATSLNVPVVLGDDGQTLEITQIEITSASPNCSKNITANNTVVLSVKPRPTASISANDFVCEGQTAPVDIYFTGTAPFNLQYNINSVPQVAVNTSLNPYSMPYTNATVGRTYAITSVTDANGCLATVLDNLTIDVPIPCFVTWNGSVDSDWNKANNWTPNNSAPSNKTSVVLKSAANQANVSSATPAAVCASLTFQPGSAPSIAAGFSLSVRGDLFGTSGNTFSGDGKVVLNGTGTQNVTGTVQLGNVEFANTSPGGVLVQSGATLEIAPIGTATFLANSKFTNNGNVVLKSSAAGTGRIATIPTTANLTAGVMTIERYLPNSASGTGSWYMMSTPFSGNNFTELSDDFKVSGLTSGFGTQGGAILPVTQPERNTVFSYNEPQNNVRLDTTQKNGWIAPANGNMAPGLGYRVYVDYYSNNLHKFDTKGSLVRNDFTFPSLSRTVNTACSPTTYNCDLGLTGWNLLGNPYPSSIDWDAASGWTMPGNLQAGFWRYNGSLGYGAYVSGLGWTGANPAPANPSVIPSSQGFFVRLATGTSGTMLVKESAKAVTSGAYLRTSTSTPSKLKISLKKPELNGSYFYSGVVRFMEDATDGFDPMLDFSNLASQNFFFSFPVANAQLMVNSMGALNEQKIVPITTNFMGGSGIYSFSFNDLNTFDAGVEVYLRDKFFNTIESVFENAEISFEVNASTMTMSDRFELVFNPVVVTSTVGLVGNHSINILPNPSKSSKGALLFVNGFSGKSVKVKLSDMTGKEMFVSSAMVSGGKAEMNLPSNLPAGIYLVKVAGENQILTKRLIVE